MKLYGLFGKGSGKMGSSVFAISGGEQVVREYNPEVSNPNTQAQIEQRAKFKLLSQLAADMAQAIAFKKNGLVSARNQFVSANYPAVLYADGSASVSLLNITLTGATRILGGVDVSRKSEGSGFVVDLGSVTDANIEKVVVVMFDRMDENRLQFLDSVVYTRSANGWETPRELIASTEPLVFYAYGIVGSGSSVDIAYEDYVVAASQRDAALSFSKKVSASGAILTATDSSLIERA